MADTADEAHRLCAVLEELVTEPGRHGHDTRHATTAGSAPSWHAQAAYAVLELARLSRTLESALRLSAGLPVRPRGGSDHNTALALGALSGLAVAARREDVNDAARALHRWSGRARITLGEVEPLRRLPRGVGEEEPRCPWCRCLTLRQQPYAGILRCVNPACRDQNGDRVVGRVEFGRLSAEPLLVWDSGDVGLGTGAGR